VSIIKAQSTDLKSYSNQADYLIISNEIFYNTLAPLIELRETQGHKVKFINIEEIYTEFQDTISQQESIQLFVSYTLKYWLDPKPQYLLLVGDINIIPSFRVKSRFFDSGYKEDSVSIDDHYAINIYEEDHKPDLAVGRIPVTTNEQLLHVVNKIIHFENFLNRSDYSIDFTCLSDYREGELIFENQTDKLITDVIPNNFNCHRIDRRADSPYYGDKNKIIESMNNGTLFLTYYGHANSIIWADTCFFTSDDVSNLTPYNLPFIFTAGTSSQCFDAQDTLSTAVRLLFSEKSGTVASFASVGLIYNSTCEYMITSFYDSLFLNPDLALGKIIQMVKSNKDITDQPDDLYLRFALLGDPALKLPTDLITVIKQNINNPVENFELYQNYPNPFNQTTVISYKLSTLSQVDLTIYNIIGQKMTTLVSKAQPEGYYQVSWDASGLSSGVYFYRLSANIGLTQTKKLILLK